MVGLGRLCCCLLYVLLEMMIVVFDMMVVLVFFSYLSVWVLCDYFCNVLDDVLCWLFVNGGVVMVMFVLGFVLLDVVEVYFVEVVEWCK